MLKTGPKKDEIRIAVQPLLDAIAPDCTINLLERRNNPNIPPRGWQDDFFEKKIRTALSLGLLEYSDVWEDGASPDKKLTQILVFLFDSPKGSSFESSEGPSLTKYVNLLLAQSANYIHELHLVVKKHFTSEKELDYSESKALVAFMRLANVQLAFNAMDLLEDLTDADGLNLAEFPGLLKWMGSSEKVDLSTLKAALKRYIQEQTTFSVKDRILFRCAKAIQSTVALDLFKKKDNASYLGGTRFDTEFQQLSAIKKGLETYPASSFQIGRSLFYASGRIIKGAFWAPVVLAQKTSHYINQVTALPFRLLKGVVQDIPLMGPVLGFAAEKLNSAKNIALPTMETMGLVWLVLLEFTRFTDETAKEKMVPNMLNTAMVELSPWTFWIYGASMATIAGMSLLSLSKSALTSFKEKFSGKELVKIVVEENLRDYETNVLTEENLDTHQALVLNVPIVLPEELKVLLTTKEQEEIVTQIARGRLKLFQKRFEDFGAAQINIVSDQDRWLPVYLPLHAAHEEQQEPNLVEQFEHLQLEEDDQLPHHGYTHY